MRSAPAWRMLAASELAEDGATVCASARAGLGGGRPQFCPPAENGSGGAPIETPRASSLADAPRLPRRPARRRPRDRDRSRARARSRARRAPRRRTGGRRAIADRARSEAARALRCANSRASARLSGSPQRHPASAPRHARMRGGDRLEQREPRERAPRRRDEALEFARSGSPCIAGARRRRSTRRSTARFKRPDAPRSPRARSRRARQSRAPCRAKQRARCVPTRRNRQRARHRCRSGRGSAGRTGDRDSRARGPPGTARAAD